MLKGFDAIVAAAQPGQQNPPRLLLLDEMGERTFDLNALVGLGFGIDYRDSKGDETRRWVKIVSYKTDPKFRLSAYCFTDKGMRTLRPEGVLSVVDVNGQVEIPEKFFARFGMAVSPAKAMIATKAVKVKAQTQAYPVIIRSDGDGFVAIPLAFPDCAKRGDTISVALAATADQVAEYLETIATAGTTLPLPAAEDGEGATAWIAVAIVPVTSKRR